ncbi:hypothetical protein TrVFT333_005915 [Trichoderma virens FT-333]|nr:hypothetical protein TrVFT333_005915 [Trichoderma virens FT-333]
MEYSRSFSGNTLGNNATLNQGDFNITVNTTSSDAKKKFLRNISKIDPVYDKKRIQTLKGPFLHESFRWVLDHDNFNRWRKESNGIFWIKGDPGKGKTMLLCGIIDEFGKDAELSSNLSYFFCQATDSRINTATAVLGGLIFSIVSRHETVFSHIQAKYEDRLEGPNAWFVLCEMFEAVIQNLPFKEPVFVVDALDECIKDCSALLRFIVQTSGRVRWLISSRNEKAIERELRSIQSPQILDLEHAEYTSNSVEIYINSRIRQIEALKDDEVLRAKTLKILKDKSMGTFLWVALVVEQLCNAAHWQVEDVLEEVPEGLESLYGLILNQASLRLSSARWKLKGQDACQILLSIVTTAERPLRLKELYTFMSYQWKHFKSVEVRV